jgi:hypothetical protein
MLILATFCAFAADPAPEPAAPPAEREAPVEDDSAEGPIVLPEETGLPASALQLEEAARSATDWAPFDEGAWGGATFGKPRLGLAHAVRGSETFLPTVLGLTVGRRWWTLVGKPNVGFEVRGVADALLAQGSGSYDLALGGATTLALDPVGLRLGVDGLATRERFGAVALAPALGLGFPVGVTFDLRVVHLFAGTTPRLVFRSGQAELEPQLDGGLGFTLGPVNLSLSAEHRVTSAGPSQRFLVGVRPILF